MMSVNFKLVFLACFGSYVYGVGATVDSSLHIIPNETILQDPNPTNNHNIRIFRRFEECVAQGGFTGILNCAASRTLKVLNRASKQSILRITPYIQIISDNNTSVRRIRKFKLVDEDTLPRDPLGRASKYIDLLSDGVLNLFSGRTMKIRLPNIMAGNIGRALEEGRGKIKKIVHPLMLGMGSNMLTVMPILIGGLALLATKALVVGKLAFAVSAVMFLLNIFTGRTPYVPPALFGSNTNGASYGTNYGTNVPGWTNSQYPYARSLVIPKGQENGQ